LDEICDMPLDLQTRLLRVLSDGHFYRVGGHQPLKANVRVIAATHQNLEQRVAEGRFREDLFHRLHVIRLRLPPLRERREDIPELVKFFLSRSGRTLGVEVKQLSPEAMAVIAAQPFPGNVRQLENLCHWISVMAPSQWVESQDLPPDMQARLPLTHNALADPSVTASVAAVPSNGLSEGSAPAVAQADTNGPGLSAHSDWAARLAELVSASLAATPQTDVSSDGRMADWSRTFERVVFGTALAHTRGRRMEAAQLLGVGRNTITRKIQELGLEEAAESAQALGGRASK
jgi:two-component system nitrogen regulation response regulator GlnG